MTNRSAIRRALYAGQAQQRQELIERQAAEREAQGLELYPLATWHAFSPDQLADVITGVTRSRTVAAEVMPHLSTAVTSYEFGTERRDLSGALIGGALWRAERTGVSDWALHLLQSEPRGVA